MAEVKAAIAKKAWDGDGVPLDESNCALIGSEEDRAVRKAAACEEPAWKGCGQAEKVEVWRIEQFQVVPYPKESYGDFYKGDSYIVLDTKKDQESGKFIRAIFFWLGEKTTTDEMGTAAYKTVELDSFFDGEPTQHREVMSHESTAFKKLFNHISYLDGGVASGFHHVATGTYTPKLLQVRRTNVDGVRIQEVTLSRESMNHGDCFILDMGEKIYCWAGDEAAAAEKAAANVAAEGIEAKRDGKAKATWDVDDAFWAELGEGTIKAASEASDKIPEPDHGEGILYRLSDSGGSLSTSEVARGDIDSSLLDTKDVMMLDTSAEIFLWVGKGASKKESRNALGTAMSYLKMNDRPNHTPIHVIKEGSDIHDATWKKIMKTSTKGAAVFKASDKPAAAPPPAEAPAAGEASLQRVGTTTLRATPDSDAAAGIMTLAELQDRAQWAAKGVDPGSREMHLSDSEFQELFGMSKGEWAAVPKWKKDAAKKKHGLF